LICQTLGTQPKAKVETAPLPSPDLGVSPGANLGVHNRRAREPVRPETGRSAESPHLRPASHRLLVLVAVLVAIGAAVWLLSGIAFEIFHILELLIVAAAVGWGGYRLGHWRGRHDRD
jgi:hypothetical protein